MGRVWSLERIMHIFCIFVPVFPSSLYFSLQNVIVPPPGTSLIAYSIYIYQVDVGIFDNNPYYYYYYFFFEY